MLIAVKLIKEACKKIKNRQKVSRNVTNCKNTSTLPMGGKIWKINLVWLNKLGPANGHPLFLFHH